MGHGGGLPAQHGHYATFGARKVRAFPGGSRARRKSASFYQRTNLGQMGAHGRPSSNSSRDASRPAHLRRAREEESASHPRSSIYLAGSLRMSGRIGGRSASRIRIATAQLCNVAPQTREAPAHRCTGAPLYLMPRSMSEAYVRSPNVTQFELPRANLAIRARGATRWKRRRYFRMAKRPLTIPSGDSTC